MKNSLFEGSFTRIIVQGGTGLPKEQRQLLPVREHIADRLAQAAVRLDFSLLELLGEPSIEFIHLRAAFFLMELEALFVGHLLTFGFGIVLVNLLEDIEDIQTLLGEGIRHIKKLPASMHQAVADDGIEFSWHVAR